MNFVHHVGES